MRPIDCRPRIALGIFTVALGVAGLPAGVHAAAASDPAPSASAGAPAPAHAASPAPDAPADPCGGPGRLLATLNRPTVGYSACAVPRGAIVLEEGYQNQFQAGASPSVASAFPQGFERVGVAKNLELDIIGPNFNRSRIGSTIATGFSDVGLGFKYQLPQAGRFTYAVDGLFSAATGTGGFGAGGPTSIVNLDIVYAASPAIGIGTTLAGAVTAGMTAPAAASPGTAPLGAPTAGTLARYGYFLPSLVVTAQIPHYYQFYAELVAQTKLAPDQGGRTFADFGVQKLLGPNLEVDGEYAISFTPVAGSRFQYVGIGLGIRVK
ncbi:MAG: hypothetical protein NVS3B16_15050 [Vulcanimicrobiaceae bacterium]